MGRPTSRRAGKYLYAIVAGLGDRTYGPIGINGGVVHTLCNGSVAAVVSDVPNEKIRPERRHLAAHQEVLKRLMEETTPLPVAFGVIADGPTAIRKSLALKWDGLLEQLERVAGKVEMGVRLIWDVPNIFEYCVNTHPELRAARDRLTGTHGEPTQNEKIELGRLFDRLLNGDREASTRRVEKNLSHRCAEIKRNPPRNEREIMNLACLVERDAQKQFEDGVFEAAKLFDNHFSFDFNGPWAPHNFVEIDLRI